MKELCCSKKDGFKLWPNCKTGLAVKYLIITVDLKVSNTVTENACKYCEYILVVW